MMAIHAGKLERPVEERVSRLESHVEHIRSDISEIKTNMKELDHKVDAMKDSMFEFRLATERSFSRLTIWGITLYIALAGSMLGVMAKGFGWIK
jgi:uncharacterized protein (UPF0335 family)